MTTKNKIVLEIDTEEAANELSRYLRSREDIRIVQDTRDFPIDFDHEELKFEHTTEDVDFDKCEATANELLDIMIWNNVNFFEATAVLQKIHTKIDPQGGDVLND